MDFSEEEFLACCGSARFAQEMVKASSSFSSHTSFAEAIDVAKHIWFNIVDINGLLQAFSAHPSIGNTPSLSSSSNPISAQWSKGEQSTALSTATSSSFQELSEWNARYKDKFGFVFLICASGKSTDEILAELKRRYMNRPLVELEIAAHEQMKITELRLGKLFLSKGVSAARNQHLGASAKKAEEDRVSIIGGHITGSPEPLVEKKHQSSNRTRPPITTHVLDVSRGSPASGINVRLDAWKGPNPGPVFEDYDPSGWTLIGSSTTDKDGRSGHLMNLIEAVEPGTYRLSFNTGKYFPEGFFPFVSLVFKIRESQKLQHFHVPLLLSPFSFTTYRGS